MDMMMEALKRHMHKNKGHDEKDPAMSEKAPVIGGGDAHQAMGPDVAAPADGGNEELIQQILEALMGHGGHTGRPAGNLTERVSDSAREKHASMKKEKVG